MWYCMQGKRECQEERGIFKNFLTRGQDMDRIFEKFWPQGGEEGYFAGDERG